MSDQSDKLRVRVYARILRDYWDRGGLKNTPSVMARVCAGYSVGEIGKCIASPALCA